ncbi:MAG TPA: MAPEG family protein [Steroidobacteraceae bacterium]|nr:MAPEG family protein [Steroidobacteraceae bacterium]
MKQTAIFAPFVLTMLLTLIVWFYMYAKRIPFLQKSKTDLNRLTAAELARISPPSVANPSDNLKNLFELPTLFYVIVLYLFVTTRVDLGYLVAAWIFFGFRVLHSAVHCTINIVILRFWLYCISALALWFMIIRAVMSTFSAG